MKFRVTQPFIAFGKTTDAGDVVELTPEQADALNAMDCISPYEIKIKSKPENKAKKKPLRSSRAAPAERKRTLKKPAKSPKK